MNQPETIYLGSALLDHWLVLASATVLSGPLIAGEELLKPGSKALAIFPYEHADRCCGTLLFMVRKEQFSWYYASFAHLLRMINDLQFTWKYGTVYQRATAADFYHKADLICPSTLQGY
jgi:hypothetical protein